MISREKSEIKSNEILQGNTLGNKVVHLNKISHGVLWWKNLTKLYVEEKKLYHQMFRKRKIIHTPPPPSTSKVKSSNAYKKTACFKPFTKESDFGSSSRGSEIGDYFFTFQSVGFVQSIIK